MTDGKWQTRTIRLSECARSHQQTADDLGISRQRVAVLCKARGAPVTAAGRPIYPHFLRWYTARRVVARIKSRLPGMSPQATAAEALRIYSNERDPMVAAEAFAAEAEYVASVVWGVNIRLNDQGIYEAKAPPKGTVAVTESDDEEEA